MSMKFGYARVSTRDQNLQMQIDDLKKEGCEIIFRIVHQSVPCSLRMARKLFTETWRLAQK